VKIIKNFPCKGNLTGRYSFSYGTHTQNKGNKMNITLYQNDFTEVGWISTLIELKVMDLNEDLKKEFKTNRIQYEGDIFSIDITIDEIVVN
jgi:hypothetical protein